jgi:hypothetical protein
MYCEVYDFPRRTLLRDGQQKIFLGLLSYNSYFEASVGSSTEYFLRRLSFSIEKNSEVPSTAIILN